MSRAKRSKRAPDAQQTGQTPSDEAPAVADPAFDRVIALFLRGELCDDAGLPRHLARAAAQMQENLLDRRIAFIRGLLRQAGMARPAIGRANGTTACNR